MNPEHLAGAPLLTRVRVHTALHAHRRVTGMAEGHYRSIHRARSLDFEDLREYVPGDDVRDVDWKASARSPHLLVRRHAANRQHEVVLVVDTGRAMAALADRTSSKRDVAVQLAGELGQIVSAHGDRVGLIAGPAAAGAFVQLACGSGDAHVERVLRLVHRAIDVTGPRSQLGALLRFAGRRLRRRSTIVIVTDEAALADAAWQSGDLRSLLHGLRSRHEVLVACVADVPLSELADAADVRTLEPGGQVPAFLRRSAAIDAGQRALAAHARARREALLGELRIASCVVGGAGDVSVALARLLAAHLHVGS